MRRINWPLLTVLAIALVGDGVLVALAWAAWRHWGG